MQDWHLLPLLPRTDARLTSAAAAAAHRREAGALQPLLQLLHAGAQLAGGQRRAAIAALAALEPLVSEPGCQEELAGPCTRWVRGCDTHAAS